MAAQQLIRNSDLWTAELIGYRDGGLIKHCAQIAVPAKVSLTATLIIASRIAKNFISFTLGRKPI